MLVRQPEGGGAVRGVPPRSVHEVDDVGVGPWGVVGEEVGEVSGADVVAWQVVHVQPGGGVAAGWGVGAGGEFLAGAGPEGAAGDGGMVVTLFVAVEGHAGEEAVDVHVEAEFFERFALSGLGRGFPWFGAAAGEEVVGLAAALAADEAEVAVLDEDDRGADRALSWRSERGHAVTPYGGRPGRACCWHRRLQS